MISYIPAYQHGQLKGQGILKGTEIQPELFLDFLKAVHKSVPVDIKLSGGFRKIQVVLKEGTDNGKGFTVQGIQRFTAKYLLDKHFAHRNRELIDQPANSKLAIAENIFSE